MTFKDPEAFRDAYYLSTADGGLDPHQQVPHAEDATPGTSMGEVKHIDIPTAARAGAALLGMAATSTPEIADMYKVGLKDSAAVKID
jgi:hypothetical protein